MISTAERTINCTVTSVMFPREEFDAGTPRWCKFNTDMGVCCGTVPFYPRHGMKLRLVGRYGEWHGQRQFSFKRLSHDTPQDSLALLRYVANLTKGVGDAAVEKIYTAHGDAWREHLNDGVVTPAQALAMQRTLDQLNADADRTDLIKYILGHGGTPRLANLAFEKWGAQSISIIEADPYHLAALDGIGFKTVDAMREKFGIGDGDPRRTIAAVDYTVRDLMESSGDSVCSRDALYSTVRELVKDGAGASLALAKLLKQDRIVCVGTDAYTSAEVVKWEKDLARYAIGTELPENGVSVAMVTDGVDFDLDQRRAIRAAVLSKGVVAITGGAGCGKTTIIKAIAKTLRAYGETVNLCAFAGKAAARMREATGLPASTIHSLLGSRGTAMGFGAGKFLGQTIIVDEASMVPSSLMHELTKRDPARLVLVGDVSQIQPVGIGAPFHDIVNNLSTCVHKLNTCYRNKEAVFMSANRIREGKVPEDHAKSRSEEFDVVRVRDAAEAEERIVALVREGAVDFEQDLILSPRNGEGSEPAAATVKALNARIQDIVNPHKPGQSLAVGDRVMVTKNCPPLNVWNGTTGTITAIDGDGKPFFRADDTGETVHITMDDIRKSIVPAYCLTIHKAQGSQYRRVYAVVLARDCAALLDRSMLYTAVTRAKTACTVFTDCGLARVVNTVRERKTYFQRLVKGDTDVFA